MNNTSMTKRLSFLAVFSLLATLIYLIASSPGGLVVSADGSIDGAANVVRSKLQGERFWHKQLLEAKIELEWKQSAPELQSKRSTRIAELEERTKQLLEELYQRNPRARPSPAERKAEALRDEADRIEQDELEQWLEVNRLKRIAELQRIVKFLESRSE